ncbi:hypothetical protein TNCV_4093251 [Trichonephila clavipes]|nr:hypothetical protein TNCV_4093251 [Trichonephila clavipes]
MQSSRINENMGRRDWDVLRMSNDDRRQRNWKVSEVVHRPNDRRNGYRGNYGNGPQRNQGYESRNRLDRDNQRFNKNNGRYQSRNRGPSENFSRVGRRDSGLLNALKIQNNQDDPSQSLKNIPIRLSAICMFPVELPYVPILLNETFTKHYGIPGQKSHLYQRKFTKNIFL